ncbi:MAG TPA: hypothetical protein VKV26_06635 [Dehalococcoidia bacterium]|nr:hypothetical protein [Dehalococcoidia bacterium]
MQTNDSALNGERRDRAAAELLRLPPAAEAAFPPLWTLVLTRLGSGATLPASEIEPWARAVSLAVSLVRQIDAGLCHCRRVDSGLIGGLVAGAIAPAVLAWLDQEPAAEPHTEAAS